MQPSEAPLSQQRRSLPDDTSGKNTGDVPPNVTRRVYWRHNELDEAHEWHTAAPGLCTCRHCERLDGHAGGRDGHSPQRLDRNHQPLGHTRTPQHQRRLPHVHGVHPERRARERGEHAIKRVKMIPAFARKYGLRCSACHTVWPELNSFGQQFRDNGYQLKNERDSPIAQNNSYIPITLRATPQFHVERGTRQLVERCRAMGRAGKWSEPSRHTASICRESICGLQERCGKTCPSFCSCLPTISDPLASKRCMFASTTSAAAPGSTSRLESSSWTISFPRSAFSSSPERRRVPEYHFVAPGSSVDFGMGDNQIGAELSGHSLNSYTRYSAAVLTSTDGEPGGENFSSYDGNGSSARHSTAGKWASSASAASRISGSDPPATRR